MTKLLTMRGYDAQKRLQLEALTNAAMLAKLALRAEHLRPSEREIARLMLEDTEGFISVLTNGRRAVRK
jgi:hypothetical protein